MSKADKMFEDADYPLIYFDDEKIIYKNSTENTTVTFFKSVFKRYEVTNQIGESRLITMKLHKAINEKVKELGW